MCGRYVVMVAIVASSGGLMFGFDNGVTGGVTGMEPFLKLFFPAVRDLLHYQHVCAPIWVYHCVEGLLGNFPSSIYE